MQMVDAHDQETGRAFKCSSLSEGVSAMTMIINLPLLVALSGMLAWLYATYQAQRATAVIPAYAITFPETGRFPESEKTLQW
jgi:hypothetical protein